MGSVPLAAEKGRDLRWRWSGRGRLGRGKKETNENDIDRGRRAGRALRVAEGTRGQVPHRGSRFRGGGARGAASRASGPGSARLGFAGRERPRIFAMDARAGKRSAGADSFGAGHGENGGRSAAAWRGGVPGERSRGGRNYPARRDFIEGGHA